MTGSAAIWSPPTIAVVAVRSFCTIGRVAVATTSSPTSTTVDVRVISSAVVRSMFTSTFVVTFLLKPTAEAASEYFPGCTFRIT